MTGIGLPSYTVQMVIDAVRQTLGSSNQYNLTTEQILAKVNEAWQLCIPLDFVNFAFKSQWTFMTQAGVDRYAFPKGSATNIIGSPSINNLKITMFSDSTMFFSSNIGTVQNYIVKQFTAEANDFPLELGPKIARGYVNTLGVAVPSVTITAFGTDGVQQVLYDDGTGVLTDGGSGTGTINYLTGFVTCSFSVNVIGNVWATFDNSSWTRPTKALFFDNVLTLRNIPDQPYVVKTQVQYIPAALKAADGLPVPTMFRYLHYKTAMLIAQDINDISRMEFIEKRLKDAILAVERLTTRIADNVRRPNQFYQPEFANPSYPMINNPFPPSIG